MVDIEKIKETFPFLSCIKYQDTEYICIIQNSDDKVISFYDTALIKTQEEKKLFLELGENWWWNSNRKIPISILLFNDMVQFRYCLKTIVNKDVEILFGPVTSLDNLIKRRLKKKQIELVAKIS